MGRQPKIDVGRYLHECREYIKWKILVENKARIAAEMERVQEELDDSCRERLTKEQARLKQEFEAICDNHAKTRGRDYIKLFT